jgi:hypothetical protein
MQSPSILNIPVLLIQFLQAASRRLNSPVVLCSSKAVRALVVEAAAAVVESEAAVGDMMRNADRSR